MLFGGCCFLFDVFIWHKILMGEEELNVLGPPPIPHLMDAPMHQPRGGYRSLCAQNGQAWRESAFLLRKAQQE